MLYSHVENSAWLIYDVAEHVNECHSLHFNIKYDFVFVSANDIYSGIELTTSVFQMHHINHATNESYPSNGTSGMICLF